MKIIAMLFLAFGTFSLFAQDGGRLQTIAAEHRAAREQQLLDAVDTYDQQPQKERCAAVEQRVAERKKQKEEDRVRLLQYVTALVAELGCCVAPAAPAD